ncbi:MAG: hypothetical protein RLZZ591_2532, partial [Pseudomonadota bacterium]
MNPSKQNQLGLFEAAIAAAATSKVEAKGAGRKLVRRKPSMMALEQRFMFDGAAVGDVVSEASKTVVVDKNVNDGLLHFAAPESAMPAAVITAQAEAEKLVADFLARPDAKQQLFTLFNGGQTGEPSAQWQAAADAFLADVAAGEVTLRVELRTSAELQGALGAFAAQGSDGQSVIYLNADWVQSGADNSAIARVLVEELGHSFDARLNATADTVGDEGERFSATVTGTDTTAPGFATDNDYRLLMIDGKLVAAEAADPTPATVGWVTLGRPSDPNKAGSDGGWTAAAPDLVGTADKPYLQYYVDSATNQIYFKIRIEAGETGLTEPAANTLIDLNGDGIPEFCLTLTVKEGTGSNSFDGISDVTVDLVNSNTYTYGILLSPLEDGGTAESNLRPNSTTIAGGLSEQFTIYDSANFHSAFSGTSVGLTDTTGNTYAAGLKIYFDSTAVATSSTPTSSDLDADGAKEHYYVLNFNLNAYAAFKTYITSNLEPSSTSVNYETLVAWPSGSDLMSGTSKIYGATVSATQDNSVNGDIGGGAFNGTETWKYIFGINDAPVAKSNTYTTLEDVDLSGNIITDVDPIAGKDSDTESTTATLSINNVTVGSTTTAFSALVVETSGPYIGYSKLTLTNGTAYLRAGGSIIYVPNLNSSLGDTFTYTVKDTGVDGLDVKVSNSATVTLNVTPVNDAPLGVADLVDAIEVGDALAVNSVATGGSAGSDPTGNVLSNDTDVDLIVAGTNPTGLVTPGTTHTVSLVTNAAKGSSTAVTSSNTSSTTSPASAIGMYGTLKIGKDGSYKYEVDNSNAAVQELRETANELIETYTYTIKDSAGATSSNTLIITIKGSNDNPAAANDYDTAKESLLTTGTGAYGGTDAVGYKATGNVLANDNDVDRYSETREVVDTSFTVSATTASTSTASATVVTAGVTTANNQEIFVAIDTDGDLRTTNDLTWTKLTQTDGTTPMLGSVSSGNLTLASADWAKFAAYASANSTTDFLPDGTPVSNVAVFSITNNGTPTVNKIFYVTASSGVTTLSGLSISDTQMTVSAGMQATWTGGSATVTNVVYTGSTLTSITLNGSVAPSNTTISFATLVGTTLQGTYGTLNFTQDVSGKYLGGYVYTPYTNTDTRPAGTINLNEGQSGTEVFNYTVKDALGAIDTATLTITVYGSGSNDPVGVNDTNVSGSAIENGGSETNPASGGGTTGTNPTGNVLSNDTDPNLIVAVTNPTGLVTPGTNAFVTTVASVETGNSDTAAASSTSSSNPAEIIGKYGTLKIGANGSYVYEIDNLNASVQALRTSSNTLQESFTYTVSDLALGNNGNLNSATLTITIEGANDAPVGVNDTGVALEAGVNAGSDATGNVLPNDTDVDAGDTKKVTLIHNDNASSQSDTPVTTSYTSLSTNYASSDGLYGTLRILSDGSYRYIVDNDNATVKALGPASTPITDTFTYTVTDTDGLLSTATLTISINGANDAPVAVNNTYTATEDTLLTATNIINDDDNGGTLGGVDYNDETSQTLTIASINGLAFSSLSDSADRNGTSDWKKVTLANGTLYIKADGTMEYEPTEHWNTGNPNTPDSFKYTLSDGSVSSNEATVTLNVTPVNDAPTINASPANGVVYEAGLTNGSDAASPSEFFSGYINVGDVDGLGNIKALAFETTGSTVIKTLTIGSGTNSSNEEFVADLAAMVGKMFATTNGTVTIDSYDNGTFGYTFALTSRTTDVANATETNAFQIRVIDNSNAASTATVTIEVVDDVPTANPDTNSATVNTELTGNVLTDAGGVDVFGADGAKTTSPVGGVVGVRPAGDPADLQTEVTVGTGATGVTGAHGTLKLYSDGSYTYLSTDTNLSTTVTDKFVYTIEDADGDRSTTTLVITLSPVIIDLDMAKTAAYDTANDAVTYTLTVTNTEQTVAHGGTGLASSGFTVTDT